MSTSITTWRSYVRPKTSATYSVRLVDLSEGGETIALIAPTSLAGADSWRNALAASVDSDRLVAGHDYRILNGGGGDGATASAIQRLLDLLRGATPETATLNGTGKRLFVRAKCPRKVGGACRITTQGLLRKGRPATVKRTVKVRKGKAKLVPLLVKPKARGKVAKRKRLLVRQRFASAGSARPSTRSAS